MQVKSSSFVRLKYPFQNSYCSSSKFVANIWHTFPVNMFTGESWRLRDRISRKWHLLGCQPKNYALKSQQVEYSLLQDCPVTLRHCRSHDKTPLEIFQRGFSMIFVPRLSQRIIEEYFCTILYPTNNNSPTIPLHNSHYQHRPHIKWLNHCFPQARCKCKLQT